MDDEKLRKATSLKEKIEKLKSGLERCEKLSVKAADSKEACNLKVYGDTKLIDHDIFEIALFAQEKRIQIELAKLGKEFTIL